MKRNTYRVTIKNYEEETTRTITVKAPTETAAKKLAQCKVHYPDGIENVKDINNPSPSDYENREHCKRIADDLSDYANKLVYRCPECNEIITVPSDWTGDEYLCPDCGNRHSENEMEMLSMYDYFEDVLDIEYRIGSDKQLRSVQIMVTCGGPNIYIDTASKQVELYWWGDRASYPIENDVCDEIDDFFEEIYQC